MASRSHVQYDRAIGGGYFGRRSVDPRTAFEIGYQEATEGMGDGANKVRDVKNYYEQRLANYLKKLPEDPDFSTIPTEFRDKLSEYLTTQKNEYVRAANVIDDLVVGSDGYMKTMSKMNQIKSSFETLDAQFKLYNETKKTTIEDIEGQAISLYGDNQANVNLLRGIFNEEYDLEIDEAGNIYFVGDDGRIGLNDLPDYGMKDFATAEKMMTMGVNAYQNALRSGVALNPNSIQYHQYSNKLKKMIYEGGKNTLMSVLYDGLVGDIVLANDPEIKQMIQGFNTGGVGFDELTKVVVDNYMKALVSQSQNGVKNRSVAIANSNADPYLNPDPKGYTTHKNIKWDTNDQPYQLNQSKDPNYPNIAIYDDGTQYYILPNGKWVKRGGGSDENETQNETENVETISSSDVNADDATRSSVSNARNFLYNKLKRQPTKEEVVAYMKDGSIPKK